MTRQGTTWPVRAYWRMQITMETRIDNNPLQRLHFPRLSYSCKITIEFLPIPLRLDCGTLHTQFDTNTVTYLSLCVCFAMLRSLLCNALYLLQQKYDLSRNQSEHFKQKFQLIFDETLSERYCPKSQGQRFSNINTGCF